MRPSEARLWASLSAVSFFHGYFDYFRTSLYEAKIEAFSPFAVNGLKGDVVPAARAEAAETAAPEVTVSVPPPSAKPPGMAWLYALIIIAVIAIAAYYLYTAAQKKVKK